MKILICPLDWGLGHATRCIPIIEELIERGCEVQIATSGDALSLLKLEFSQITFHPISSYRPVYSSFSFLLSMAMQTPKFLNAINREHVEIEKIITTEEVDVVISDNRYGCWSSSIPSVLITHQLNIKVPFGLSWLVNGANHRAIRKFSECWIPDWPGVNSLSGELSTNRGLNVTHIGPLSRFKKMNPGKIIYDIIAIISGPEPQRRIFEKSVRSELMKLGRKSLLVQGLPNRMERKTNGVVDEVTHLSSAELNRAILESDIVLSRPGYSTIMDLATLGKKAIFIPTPGQTEQEYLGSEMMKKKIAFCVAQSDFDLEVALKEALKYPGFGKQNSNDLLKITLDKILI